MNFSKKVGIIFLITTVFVFAICVTVFFFSFKLTYKDLVTYNARENNIEASLIFSVIKAESKFDTNAKSKAGAIGLMQIKLETANYMLSLLGESEITEDDLYLPNINIKLGTKYLDYLFERFEDFDVTICAYNAGETVVRSWLQNNEHSHDGKTLSKIPYQETSNYLKKVKFNKSIYDRILQ